MTTFVRAIAAGAIGLAMTAAAGSAAAAELITNGTFSAGATGYNTQYSSTDATGYQYINSNPRNVCACFANIDGNANGHGNQLILDGAANAGYFFQQTVNIVAGTTYRVSFDAVNLGTAGPQPNIQATINGVPVIVTGALSYDDTYATYATSFDAGTATTATITLSDLTMDHSYNDFAIDNVSFTGAAAAAVPEVATWMMVIVGFGLTGTAMRRRGAAAALARA